MNCFKYIENAKEIVIENPKKIAEKIKYIRVADERPELPKIENAKEIIKARCNNKAKEIYGEKLPRKIKERLELELNSIIQNNFETIYLMCSEMVEYSHKLGYKVGNRGSVGNSFVAYLLSITEINPIDYNLPFEMFAGIHYDREPDIDLNFSGEIRDKIFEFLQEKYGKENVIWCGTIGTLADRTVEKCYKEYVKEYGDENLPNESELIHKICGGLCGVKRCTGEHPGGVFILPNGYNVNKLCPIEIGADGKPKTHVDYHSLYGMYKFDILVHDDPTMLHELEKATNMDSDEIDLNDEDVLELFKHANDASYKISVDGIPEFGTNFVKNMIDIAKPQNFNDLVCISALSHGTDTWCYNAENLIKDEGIRVSEVISNRADLFNYLVEHKIDKEIAFNIVEFVRKGKARKSWKHQGNTDRNWEKYKKIMREHDIPEWYIHSAEKIEYLFPKSHSIGYTMFAFRIAWYMCQRDGAFGMRFSAS